ncbi:MAG TPA: thioredoxin TrxC [Polyangiaceae bacterium]|nr:thioredoxin TrxC [Polyangiaceae bacterium]
MIVECSGCSRPNRLPAARMQERAKCALCKAPLLPPSHPVALGSAADFEELIRDAPGPVLVDFWAAWCGPCRAVAPELEKLAQSRAGRLVVAKVDTEALQDVSARYGIRSIPTLVLFRGGQEAERVSGAMPASAIAAKFGI